LNPSDSDPHRPVIPAKLVVGAGIEQPRLCLVLSPFDEHIPSAGAQPDGGDSILQQVCKGPHNWVMFISCAGFAVPALVHLYMHRCLADYVAAFGLLCVTCTSTLCDVFCIYYGVYDDGSFLAVESDRGNNGNNNKDAPCASEVPSTFASESNESFLSKCRKSSFGSHHYGKTALAGGRSAHSVRSLIAETGAHGEVVAPDKWNNLSRTVDRATCVMITAPSLLWFVWCVRPSIVANIKFFVIFGIAFACNVVGQKYRTKNPCGFIIEDGKRKVDPDYKIFERFHATWHFLLIFIFTLSALDRPGGGA